MGQKERAAADFRRELELEKTPDDYFTSPFALYFLGQPKAAAARMDSIMAKATTNKPTMRPVSTHFAATSSRHSPIWSAR